MKLYISCYFLCDKVCDKVCDKGCDNFFCHICKNIFTFSCHGVVTDLSQDLSQALSLMIQGFYLFCDKCDKKNTNLAKYRVLVQNVSNNGTKTRISLYTRVRTHGCHTEPQNNK